MIKAPVIAINRIRIGKIFYDATYISWPSLGIAILHSMEVSKDQQ